MVRNFFYLSPAISYCIDLPGRLLLCAMENSPACYVIGSLAAIGWLHAVKDNVDRDDTVVGAMFWDNGWSEIVRIYLCHATKCVV